MTAKVRHFAVTGDPVAHSKSPVMHAAAYRVLGMPHTYEAVRATVAELPALVQRLRDGTLDGLNVTVPHKRHVLDLVDDIAPSAAAVGAANTLVRTEAGKITAHNTDVPALAEEIAQLAKDRAAWSSSRALVLGRGGAARSALVALIAHLGFRRVTVRARSPVDDALRSAFERAHPEAEITYELLVPSKENERDVAVIVQATSAGMTGADPGDTVAAAVAWDALPPAAVALDVVYAPAETPFLRASAARGLPHANGLGMLARQGALAFQLWLGVPAPYEAMFDAIRVAR